MSFNASVTIINESDFDQDGLYQIHPGCTQIFPLIIPSLSSTRLTTNHLYKNSQDWSISWWITIEPLDGIVLSPGYGHFHMTRRTEVFEIFDLLIESSDPNRLALSANQSYFINVKNLQNSVNGYQLLIEPQNIFFPPNT